MEHHAYVYEGPQKLLTELAENARTLFRFNLSPPAGGDPDVQVMAFEKFGIDDSEALKTATSFKTVSGRALYIVGMGTVTTEAQQALLKLFEEPQRGVIFVLLVPHGALIQTLRSRLLVYPDKLNIKSALSSEAKVFLKSVHKLRSAFIAELLDDEEGMRERVRVFLNSLEGELYSRLTKSKDDKKIRQEITGGLEDIAKVRSYTSDRSPALKMLLEHLATAVPQL